MKAQLFTLKTFWGRYLIFSILVLIISISAFFFELSSFPTAMTGAIFLFIAPHFTYSMIRAFIAVNRDFFRAKSTNKRGWPYYFLMGLGIILILYSLYQTIFQSEFSALPFTSIGVAILLAGYDTTNK